MKYCIHCGHEIMPNAVVCIHCGRVVQSEVKNEQTQSVAIPTKQATKNNALCIAGFVVSFFFGLVGLILSCIGLKQAQKRNEGCQGLAIAGIVISCIVTIIQTIVFLRFALVFCVLLFFMLAGFLAIIVSAIGSTGK